MNKKIIKFILSGSLLSSILIFILLIPVLMILDFFGGEIITNGYVENNLEYADEYLRVLNKNITQNKNGYVPLSRILKFYLEDDSLSFDEIYKNNLDLENKSLVPLEEVCFKYYSDFSVCDNPIEEISYKPFNSPIDLSVVTITSFFAQERVVFNNFDIHYAWDLAAPAKTDVYSVGEGIVKEVRFNQAKNETDKNNGGGNQIKIQYEVSGKDITVIFAHLYPNSALVKEGDKVDYGQKIAEVGTTGYSTGNHLHYEVSIDNVKIDGMELINFDL